MNEKELLVNLYEGYVKQAALNVNKLNSSLPHEYRNLQAERDNVISSLKADLKKAEIKLKFEKENKKNKTKDVALLELEVTEAKDKLKTGILKADYNFEKKFQELKTEIQTAQLSLERERNYLKYAIEEKERGFSL